MNPEHCNIASCFPLDHPQLVTRNLIRMLFLTQPSTLILGDIKILSQVDYFRI
jgi:hypothetical protein